MDSWIFNEGKTKNAYRQLVVNQGVPSLWGMFKLFRLNEIMRQAGDKEFAQALSTLGKYGLCGLCKKEVALFNSRIVQETDIPDDAIYLYHTNDRKNGMCERRLDSKPGETFKNYAKHVPRGEGKDLAHAIEYVRNKACNLPANKCSNLANMLPLKVNVKYMLFANMDVSDGLVNGTTGTLRKIDKARDERNDKMYATLLWIEFDDPDVGEKLRTKHKNLYHDKQIAKDPVDPKWTPFLPTTCNVKVRSGAKWSIDRVQFALDVAEAITIDKAQGQTYSKVAFDLNQVDRRGKNTLTRAHLYVAWSRVRCLDDLYLFGANSIDYGKEHANWTERVRKLVAKEKMEKEASYVEMRRMEKEAAFENRFPFTEESYLKPENRPPISICVHNVANLRSHLEGVKADFGIMNADVVVLLETATKTCEKSINQVLNAKGYKDNYYTEFAIPNYILLLMGSCKSNWHKVGCALYVSKRTQVRNFKVYRDNSDKGDGVYKDTKDLCEIGMFGFHIGDREVRVIYLYNHPKRTLERFYQSLKTYMREHGLDWQSDRGKTSIYVLGDINLDLKKMIQTPCDKDIEYFGKFLFDIHVLINYSFKCFSFLLKGKMKNKLGLQPILPENADKIDFYVSTDRDSCVDWCMSNVTKDNSERLTVYESWFSDHKPLWLEILN